MKMAKKAFSVVLALVMLVNVFAIAAFAAGTDSAVDLYISADKETYAPGDEIVLTISEQVVESVGNMLAAGQYTLGYTSSAIEPYTTSTALADHGFTLLKGHYDETMSQVVFNDNLISTYSDFIDESQKDYGWDKMIMYCVADDGTATGFDATTSKADLFTIKMKVSETATDGTYTIGFNMGSYKNYTAYSADQAWQAIPGHDDDLGYGTTTNYSYGTCTITVSSAEPSPVYAKGSQIRFNGTEADGAKANFDVRTRAALKAEDFAAICGSEENAKALAEAGKLQVGFVYTAGTMDVATAKAVATGTAADGYYNKPVTYIRSTGTEYIWTCLIKNADYNDSVQALGYIIVDGTPYYFDAASETTFSTLYEAWYDDYTASLS